MKRYEILLVITILMTVLTACNQEKIEKKNVKDLEEKQSVYKIYYLNNMKTALEQEEYTSFNKNTEELIEELLNAMRKFPKDLSYKKAIPDFVSVKGYKYSKSDGELKLNFDSSYGNLKGVSEILCRVAIVKTLCQIEGIDFVGFSVDGRPLLDSNKKLVGFMSEENIIDNTGGENAIVTLFFANKKGDKLTQTTVRINYDGAVPLEQVIIEQLIKGPQVIEGVNKKQVYPTIPSNTILEKTTTKNGLCSVYFNSGFLEKLEGVTDEVAIYSVVNSIEMLPSITKVQFYINGELVKNFKNYKGFDKVMERNLDIVIKK